MDSATIIPSSIKIFSGKKIISDSLWSFNIEKSEIIFSKIIDSSFNISYRILPFYFNEKKNTYDSLKIIPQKKYSPKLSNRNKDIFSDDKINTQGSIIRGFNVGNNQDPVLNSKMNLQISGQLSNDLQIEAVISDETMPIQPDGNTAQIQDFNKIHFKIFNPNFSIVAGDIEIKQKNTFLRYNKQFNGIQYSLSKQNDSLVSNNFSFGVAVSKGKYFRQIISAVEGSQGPYKLLGQNGETFILVLSGSERVYIDGKLLMRGETNDYTIDYNSAQITFTPQNPITKDTRIIVEFEYSERNFSRFTTFSKNTFKVGKSDFYIDYYAEKDAKNQAIDLDLNDTMKQILYNVGDDIQNAVYQSYSQSDYYADRVLYKKVDTIVDGNSYEVFVLSSEKYAMLYSVNFSYVGANSGDYIISTDNVNGRAYKWLAPENGVKQGDYSAKKLIASPKKKSVFEFGGNIDLVNKSKLKFSTAISNTDLNLFSDKNDRDNYGAALDLSFSKVFQKNIQDSSFSQLNLDYSFVAKLFSGVELFKNQEFERDWNLDTLFISDEHTFDFGIMNKKNNSSFNFNFTTLLLPHEYYGVKPLVKGNRAGEKFSYNYSASYLFSEITEKYKTDFLRTFFNADYKIKNSVLGIIFDSETNYWKSNTNGSYLANSYSFYSASAYVEKNDSTQNFYRIMYKKRWDYLPKSGEIRMSDISDNFSILYRIFRTNINSDLLINYRRLRVVDTSFTNQKSENNLNSRATLNFSILKESINNNLYLGLSSGLEQKLEFVYVEVEASKGVFTWNDYNNDGIKQIDEFEIAQFADKASFVRVPLQSQNYLRVFTKKITNTTSFIPARIFLNNEKLKNIFSKINNTFTYSIDYKDENFSMLDFSFENAIKYNLLIYNIFSVNPLDGVSFSYVLQNNNSKIVIINGEDSFFRKNNKFILKYKLNSNWNIQTDFNVFSRLSKSEYSIHRNYDFRGQKTSVKLIYTINIADFVIDYSYSDKRNILGNEKLFSNKLNLNYKSLVKKNYYLDLDFSLINNNFHGTSTTSVAYVILEGLKPGFNSTWQVAIKRNLSKVLQISILYSGRYSLGFRTIHNGSINIVAYL